MTVAIFNSISFVFLISAIIFARKKMIRNHVICICVCLVCTLILLYFFIKVRIVGDTFIHTGGMMESRPFVILLVTHIAAALASFVMTPFAVWFGVSTKYRYTRHKKFVRWLAPIWVYSSFTGILLYLIPLI